MEDRVEPSRPVNAPFTLFEISWEVCNKVGGIHTVVSSKARSLVERLGDEYVAVGPWLLQAEERGAGFEEEAGFEEFEESCREIGVPVRVGRWLVPGRPRTILVEFTGLMPQKDAWLATLWERYKVDSLMGGWDYVEPVMFGRAAGMVVEQWWKEHVAPARRDAVAQAHEWMTGSALLHLKEKVPPVGTVFTTHATVLGRSIASTGASPVAGLGGGSVDEAARKRGVGAKHSMEAACAREADVFTTVSEVTALEAEVFLGRRPTPILPNGIDPAVAESIASAATPGEARTRLLRAASRFLGEPVDGAVLLATSGRYEFHNKGIDLFLAALAEVNRRPGRQVAAFLFVPAGSSGPRVPLLEGEGRADPRHVSTHHLFDPDGDPIQKACAALGLDNPQGSRVKVVHVPVYLHPGDDAFRLPYESVIRGVDLTCFPSFYEPWGLTPAESLALGVPTVTADGAGFGHWMRGRQTAAPEALTVLCREGVPDAEAAKALADHLQAFVESPPDRAAVAAACRRAVEEVAWSELVSRYLEAFEIARDEAAPRSAPATATTARAFPRGRAHRKPAPRPRLVQFEVSGSLPPSMAGLQELARNYSWTWDLETRRIFEELTPGGWLASGGNPLQLLRDMPRKEVLARAADREFAGRVARALERLHATLGRPEDRACASAGITWERPVAYFCAEFGIESTLQTYTGGLGILAGDHLRSASDLGIPLVGVGLFYHRGYMRQRLSPEGEQIWSPADNDPERHALELARDARGRPLGLPVHFPGGKVVLQAWKAMVGRVPLYLLDADLPENRAEDRAITHHLYGGDEEMRLRQEIVLGRGGDRLLEALGVEPAVIHMNEGHAAFAPLARVAHLVRHAGLTFDEAREAVRARTVFTTHTPVPAGHDRFPESLVRRYFSNVESWLGLPWDRFYALGTSEEDPEGFQTTRLAVRFASFVNGVSAIHGGVSRRLLSEAWPSLLPSEAPVEWVTNGVHLPTWTSAEIGALVRPSGGAPTGADFAERGGALGASALWDARRAGRRRLLEAVAGRIRLAAAERRDPPDLVRRMLAGLDDRALLVGFARRFASYKRADLLFRDPGALKALLSDEDAPVRIFFAGKAHPRDGHGQQILHRVARFARSEEFLGRIFFLEDYDMDLARLLVQGADVWLNTPIRPHEACGTSGMKAAANGSLNLSVRDGWWDEACDGRNGWGVIAGVAGEKPEAVDALDGDEVMRLLEKEVVPLFFDRDEDGIPRRWLERVAHCLATIPPRFGTERMVQEYRDRAYLPRARAGDALDAESHEGARGLVQRHRRLRRGFAGVRISQSGLPQAERIEVRDTISVWVEVDHGPLAPEDLRVEFVLGRRERDGRPGRSVVVPMDPAGAPEGARRRYEVSCCMSESGSFACGVRVRVRQEGPPDPALADLVVWA